MAARESIIYLDHHATTPVDPAVIEAMLPWFREKPGNAASKSHAYGHEAGDAVEAARTQVADLLGANPREIVFTSGSTESDNLAIKGAFAAAEDRNHVITQRTEHKAVLDSVSRLERGGARVTLLDVDRQGRIELQALEKALCDDTALVSLMLTNNEVGTVHDIAGAASLARAAGARMHCDASQGLGYIPLDVTEAGVDLLSLTAHKFYGPKGVGALYVRRRPRVNVIAEMDGGGHEFGMRSGTLAVPGIVALGAAADLMRRQGPTEAARLRRLRLRLYNAIAQGLEGVHLNGPALDEGRHPGNLNVSFEHVEGEGLLLALTGVVAVSSGSACSSAGTEPSFVLRAMGISRDLASASIRYGLGRDTTETEVDRVAEHTIKVVKRLRRANPEWRLRGESIDW